MMNLDSLILYSLPDSLEQLQGIPLARRLTRLAAEKGWKGNLWHHYLTQSLVEDENPFSLACERRDAPTGSLWELALGDMQVFYELYRWQDAAPQWSVLTNFQQEKDPSREAAAVMELSKALSEASSPEAMLMALTAFYRTHGLGMLGLGQVFRVDGTGKLYPVENRRSVRLSDLVGYESQKKALVDNTEAFLRGARANNVMLYGDAGTGKSTSVQAITEEYAPQGLRLIELYKHQFALIPELFLSIKNRNYRFLVLLDDLSFEENEVEYKYLKAVLEGGAEAAPDNIRIYATSNRRHLIKETWNDRSDMEHNGDIHRSDTMEEKLSLSARFGLKIFYPNPSFEEYQNIVASIVAREDGLGEISKEQLRTAAATWQVRCGSRSGRTARQFVDSLSCNAPWETPGKDE